MRLVALCLKIELGVLSAYCNITHARWNKRSAYLQITFFYLIEIDEVYACFSDCSLYISFPIFSKLLIIFAYFYEPFHSTLFYLTNLIVC